MGKPIFILFLALLAPFLEAQNLSPQQSHSKDSLTAQLKADSTHIYRFQKYRPFINLDQRNSFIRNQSININGLQLGVLINERHVFGLGGYVITSSSKQIVKTKTEKNIPTNRTLNMNYLTFFYQYVILDRRFWEIDFQTEVGLGKYDYKYYDPNTSRLLADRSAGMLVGGIGPLLAFKPTKWVGIIGMVGYRFTSEKNANLNFNGFYYSYGAWFDIRQIIRDYKYYVVKKRKYKKQINQLLTSSN
ncbi:MAG TPA: hypothetical protein VK835_00780 [Bacteroidia bacterium]|jgi:hypothetical protein|nr:hypothetical protein [Bacteroidia bacterium]